MSWTDAHLHLQDPRLGDSGPVLAAMQRAGVTRAVVNATCEADWEAVAAVVAAAGPDFLPAYGIHPWQADQVADGWLDRLRQRLRDDPRASVGEIGLDGWIGQPSLDAQRGVFVAQWRLAQELGRPVSIHALKAWEPLFEVFADHPPTVPFLMHSFAGSPEIAKRLIALGAFFSFSGHFLHPRKAKVAEMFQTLPKERILMESDAPDMLPPESWITHPQEQGVNHPANLPAIGRGLAELLEMPVGDLAALTRRNAEQVFGW